MGQDWIIDVLTDLRSFARKNDLPLLAEQLDETLTVATKQIAGLRERPATWAPPEQADIGHLQKDDSMG